MGTTGSSTGSSMNAGLPELIARIRAFTPVPLAVGFGVSTRTHFEAVAASGADAVVVGSKIIQVIRDGHADDKVDENEALEAYCRSLTGKGTPMGDIKLLNVPGMGSHDLTKEDVEPAYPIPAAKPLVEDSLARADDLPANGKKAGNDDAEFLIPARFGAFGGQYVPEALVDCLSELEKAHFDAMKDPEFWKEFEGMFTYMNRPSGLYEAERLTEYAGGAKIWMKREDLNHTGSHKINNAIGQVSE